MIVQQEKISLETSGNMTQERFEIEDSSHLFHILSNLYTDPLGSVIREISTNCLDAHKMIDKENVPFKIFLPETLNENRLGFRDYGPGMTRSEVSTIYKRYGKSTKTNTNKLTGYLGLGSKSPFAITNSFVVTSNVNRGFDFHMDFINMKENIKLYKNFNYSNATWNSTQTHFYNMVKNNRGEPTVIVMGNSFTNNKTGMFIEIPISNSLRSRIVSSIKKQLRFFKVKPLVDIEFDNVQYKKYNHITNNIKIWNKSNHPSNFSYNDLNNTLIQGEIGYDLNLKMLLESIESNINKKFLYIVPFLQNLISNEQHLRILLFSDMGKITFHPSREYLIFDNKTIEYLVNELSKLKEIVDNNIKKLFLKYLENNKFESNNYLIKKFNFYSLNLKNNSIGYIIDKYNNTELEELLSVYLTYKKTKINKKLNVNFFLNQLDRNQKFIFDNTGLENRKKISQGITYKEKKCIPHEPFSCYYLEYEKEYIKRLNIKKIKHCRNLLKYSKENNFSKGMLKNIINAVNNFKITDIKKKYECEGNFFYKNQKVHNNIYNKKEYSLVILEKNRSNTLSKYLKELALIKNKDIYCMYLEKGNSQEFKEILKDSIISNSKINIYSIHDLKRIFNSKIKRKSKLSKPRAPKAEKKLIKLENFECIDEQGRYVSYYNLDKEQQEYKKYYIYQSDYISKRNIIKQGEFEGIEIKRDDIYTITRIFSSQNIHNFNNSIIIKACTKKDLESLKQYNITNIFDIINITNLKKISKYFKMPSIKYGKKTFISNKNCKINSEYFIFNSFFKSKLKEILDKVSWKLEEEDYNNIFSNLKTQVGPFIFKYILVTLYNNKQLLHTKSMPFDFQKYMKKENSEDNIFIDINMFNKYIEDKCVLINSYKLNNKEYYNEALTYYKTKKSKFNLSQIKKNLIEDDSIFSDDYKQDLKNLLIFIDNIYSSKRNEIEKYFKEYIDDMYNI